MRAEPGPRRHGDLPVPAPRRGQARRDRARGRRHRLRRRRAARGDAGLHPRARSPRALEAEPVSTYPAADGPARAARGDRGVGAAPLRRRRSTPTPRSSRRMGSKEAIFHLAQVVAGARRPGRRHHARLSRVPARGALFAGRRGRRAPRSIAARGWLPDLDAVDWDGVALLWLNSPQQPDGRHGAARALRARRGAGARARLRPGLRRGLLGAVVRGRPAGQRAAARRPHERRRLQHALQALVDARLPLRVRRRRSRSSSPRSSATARTSASRPQTFIQRAAAAAWADEEHVIEVRERYRAKRDALLPALLEAGLEPSGGDALVLPVAARAGRRGRRGLRAAPARAARHRRSPPGPFFGPGGEGHVRIALVPTPEDCRRAAELLASGA